MVNKPSIFDGFKPEDIILAFFPCIRFENQIMLGFRGQQHGMEDWSFRQKMVHDKKLMSELKTNYDLVNNLFILCMDRGLRLIMENPYSEEHFLRRYWCYPAAIIDKDRRLNGDYFKKPTQYWFLNIKPKQNLIFEVIDYVAIEATAQSRGDTWSKKCKADFEKTGAKTIRQGRSMIHPQYANRFIRQYILDPMEVMK